MHVTNLRLHKVSLQSGKYQRISVFYYPARRFFDRSKTSRKKLEKNSSAIMQNKKMNE